MHHAIPITFGLLLTVFAWTSIAQTPGTGMPIEKPDKPAAGKGLDGVTGTLIVLNKSEASASLIDLASGIEVKRVPTGVGPHEVAVSPDGGTAIVANYGEGQPGRTLSVIDLAKGTLTKTIDLEKYHRPHGIAFLPDGERVVVTAEAEQMLLVVNINSGTVERAMETEARVSHMVALSPDFKRAFVSNIGSHSMTVFDLEKGERLGHVPTGPQAEGIDVSPDGSQVWVSNRAGNTITVVDARSLEVIATMDSPTFPIRLKFMPDGTKVLVSNANSGDVAVFDAKERKEVTRIAMNEKAAEDTEDRLFSDQFGNSPVPVGILILPAGTHAFVANTNADVVTVLDLKAWTIAGRLKAGKQPDGLGYTPIVVDQ